MPPQNCRHPSTTLRLRRPAISSGVDSSVTAVACQVGQQVKARQLLISLAPTHTKEGTPA